MRIEYFQLIDRIVDLNLADRKISSETTVPTKSTIFVPSFLSRANSESKFL